MEERVSQPLSAKIENILPRIYINWTNNAFKEKWEWPQIDPFLGLYIDAKRKLKLKKAATAKNLLDPSSTKTKVTQNFNKTLNKKQTGKM